MKLADVRTVSSVLWPSSAGGDSQHMAASQGFDIDFAQGLVTVKKADVTRLIPMSNVIYMTPAVEAKAGK